jgi:DNA repair protein RecO (recombination protein O)
MNDRGRRAPQPAYVLHRYDWSESSLILELFTRTQGRIAVVAKGAKRPYSQLRAVLLPFQRLLVNAGHRRGDDQAEVQLLRSAEWAGGGTMPGGAGLLTGFYLNELLMKGLARQDPHPALFDAYEFTLPWLALAGDDASLQAALRAFELVLLRHTGVLPELDCVTQTQAPLQPGAAYRIAPQAGVALAPDADDGLPGATLAAVERALAAGDLDALRGACALAPQARSTLKTQLRALLHYHLGTAAMRTRQVMLDAQKLLEPLPEPHPAA